MYKDLFRFAFFRPLCAHTVRIDMPPPPSTRRRRERAPPPGRPRASFHRRAAHLRAPWPQMSDEPPRGARTAYQRPRASLLHVGTADDASARRFSRQPAATTNGGCAAARRHARRRADGRSTLERRAAQVRHATPEAKARGSLAVEWPRSASGIPCATFHVRPCTSVYVSWLRANAKCTAKERKSSNGNVAT